jgi:hypothetical protein
MRRASVKKRQVELNSAFRTGTVQRGIFRGKKLDLLLSFLRNRTQNAVC